MEIEDYTTRSYNILVFLNCTLDYSKLPQDKHHLLPKLNFFFFFIILNFLLCDLFTNVYMWEAGVCYFQLK